MGLVLVVESAAAGLVAAVAAYRTPQVELQKAMEAEVKAPSGLCNLWAGHR